MNRNRWHFPRTDFARKVLNLIADGPGNALTMFGPRRMGKTEFLLEDLGPLAECEGHQVIYISFWQSRLSPLAVLLNDLETGLSKASFVERIKNAANIVSPKLRLSGSLYGAKLEGEVDLTKLKGEAPTELLLHLDSLIGRIAGKKKRTLIFFDEIQELARNPNNDTLVAALRTSLDKRKNSIGVVFTGSSRAGLAAMFSDKEAPFFHFAVQIDLPPLGDNFVAHQLKAFEVTSKRKLDYAKALEAFKSLHCNPFFFRGLLEVMLYDEGLDFPSALEKQRDRIQDNLGYADIWLSISPIQRACMLVVAQGEKPFAQSTREKIAEMIQEDTPSAGRIQAALRKLERLDVIDRWQGEWSIDDAEFSRWLLTREDDL